MDNSASESSAPVGGTGVLRYRGIARAAAALSCMAACSSASGADIRLTGPACATAGSIIEVGVVVDPEGATVVGLQALLRYDSTMLSFLSFDDGDAPYVVPIWASADEAASALDIAVGFDPESGQHGSPVAVAKRIRFEVRASAGECEVANLISFREDPPFKTMLTLFGGSGVDPELVALPTLVVSPPPSFGQLADITVVPPLRMDCVVPPVAPPEMPPICGANPTVTFVRSDGAAAYDAPVCRLDSPVSITWTATDACGRSATATQKVTVLGLAGDLNADGTVDALDLAAILAAWGNSSGVGDLNGDMMTDGLDLSALLSRWRDSIP